MATDPRRRRLVKTETDPRETSNAHQSGSILFEGDDAMDEDEDLFDSEEPLQDEPQQTASSAAGATADGDGEACRTQAYGKANAAGKETRATERKASDSIREASFRS